MRRFFLILLVVLATVALLAVPAFAKKKKKKKKKGEEEPPPVGLMQVGKMQCWNPPDFAKINESNRVLQRSDALAYLQQLVNGEILDGDFQIKDLQDLEYFETAFFGRPQLLDDWLTTNLEKCKAVGGGKLSASDYLDYLSKIGRELEAGECYKPLTYEYHNFMDVQASWQFRLHVCKGDKFLVETTGVDNGKYTVSDTGKYRDNVYITADGMPVAAAGKYEKVKELPEDVIMEPAGDRGVVAEEPWGAVIMRFEHEDGSMTKYHLVGAALEFAAEEHGFVSFTVNDTQYYDNKFHDWKGGIDYVGIDIYPVETEEKL
jgi:hypothetical protein